MMLVFLYVESVLGDITPSTVHQCGAAKCVEPQAIDHFNVLEQNVGSV